MDTAYLYMPAAGCLGVILGLVVPIKPLGILLGVVVGALLVGFIGASIWGSQNSVWFFRVALMVAPLYGALLFGGAFLSSSVAHAFHSRSAGGRRSDDAA
jgi:hypothetical protein